MADWLLVLSGMGLGASCALAGAALGTSELRRRCRMLELDRDASRSALLLSDKFFRMGILKIEQRCTCGAASGAYEKLPPPPQPGFAARRKGEGRNA